MRCGAFRPAAAGWAFLGLWVVTLLPALAEPGDPRVPPGRHTAHLSIGLIMTGLDYTHPEIAARLARDGEGELIGWDLIDHDRTPYASAPTTTTDAHGGDGTALALDLIRAAAGKADIALVPVRVDPTQPLTIAKALAFLSQTPARIAVVPMWGRDALPWADFQTAADHFTALEIAVRQCPNFDAREQEKIYPRDLASEARSAPNSGPERRPETAWLDVITERPCLDAQ